MDWLRMESEFDDPEKKHFEIVERKGLGHPDTLADALAEEVSRAYALECLDRFGVSLHHNVDKLYIGGGLTHQGFGFVDVEKPVKVIINGRMSNTMNGEAIDIATIQIQATKSYLRVMLPHLDVDRHVMIITNATQHTKHPYWFSPRDIADVPDAKSVFANDTSVLVSHWPLSLSERLALNLEHFFWNYAGETVIGPKFAHFGQDIKVMVLREGGEIDITLCVPVICTEVANFDEYVDRIRSIEQTLLELARIEAEGSGASITLRVNPDEKVGYRNYSLALGSCIECGEEGMVGRGNSISGVISIHRAHTMEAPAGKNPVYHSGRVLGYLNRKLARLIHEQFGVKCAVIALTKNGHSLVPPSRLIIQTDRVIPLNEAQCLIEEQFVGSDYLRELLSTKIVI